MPSYKIVHVGCGGMAGEWLKTAAARPDLEIVGLVDLQPANAQRRQEEFAPRALADADLASVLARTRPDIVFNCTVPEAHHAVTLAALRAGAHVLCEKPLAASMTEARELVAEAARLGRTFAVMQNRRYNNGIRTARRLIASGAIGQLTTLNVDFFIGAHFGGFREHIDHILLLDMSIHHFDMARFLSGANPVGVMCREWNPPGSWYQHGANATAVFDLEGGVVLNYRGSWCAEGFPTSWNAQWRITGTKGTLLWDDSGVRLETVAKAGGFISEMEAVPVAVDDFHGYNDSHASVIGRFVDCLRQGTPPETVASDNIHSLAMVFAAIESAGKGCAVRVEV